MADQKRIVLRSGHATPKNIVLYVLPVADASLGTTIYLTETHVTPKNIILRNPATEPVTGAETGESAAPLSAVATITAAGQKASESAAPLVAVASIVAAGQEGEDEAAPLSAVATITVEGFRAAESAAPLSAVASITAAGEKTSETSESEGHGALRGVEYWRTVRKNREYKRKLRELYTEVRAADPPPIAEDRIEAVAPALRGLPPAEAIDWAAMAAETEQRLWAALEAAIEAIEQDDEEIILLLAA